MEQLLAITTNDPPQSRKGQTIALSFLFQIEPRQREAYVASVLAYLIAVMVYRCFVMVYQCSLKRLLSIIVQIFNLFTKFPQLLS